jgi:ER membrane protein complex subunit 3
MLQRGIQTADMDVRWVSSLSWYFLNFFGLNGLYRIILGGDECGSLTRLTFLLPPT